MDSITNWYDKLMDRVPNFVGALILLVVAFLCAFLIKKLVFKIMSVLKFDSALDKSKIDNERRSVLKSFVANIFFLITFALFVPAIFSKLELEGVSEPIVNMSNKLLGYMPDIIAAIVILVVGLLIAKTVKEILLPVFKKLNFDKYLEKIGFESSDKVSIADVIVNVIYVILLVPIIIASLNALKIDAISKPAIDMLNNVFVFMPRIAIAIAILFVGKFISNLVQSVLEKVLVSIGTDKVTKKAFSAADTKISKDFSLSRIISYVVKYIIVIIFLVEGLNILKLEVLTRIGNSIITYMPYGISAIIILGITILVANFVEAMINKKFENNKITALIVKVIILTIGAFITLYQIGIAKAMVNSAFIIVLCAFAVAFAISFGIGGRDFASRMLTRLEDRIDTKDKKKSKK